MQPAPSPFVVSGPSRAWYVLGGVLVAVGVIAAIALIVDAVRDDGFGVVPIHGRVTVPGDGVVSLPEAGGYTLYWEPDAAPSDADDIAPPPLEFFVQEADSGDPLPTADYGGRFTYTLGGRKGLALRTFRAEAGGDVLVTAVGPPGVIGSVAVGEGIDLSGVARIGAGVGVGFVGVAAGGAVIGITAWRRFRARHPKVLVPGQWSASAPAPPPPRHP